MFMKFACSNSSGPHPDHKSKSIRAFDNPLRWCDRIWNVVMKSGTPGGVVLDGRAGGLRRYNPMVPRRINRRQVLTFPTVKTRKIRLRLHDSNRDLRLCEVLVYE
jgi:hypothetical protein